MPRNDLVDFWEWLKKQPPHLVFLAAFVVIIVLSQIGGCCYRGEVLWWLP